MANRVDPGSLLALQWKVENIRNFCILAHVDHGKTTLSDSLVSANGFISAKLAGKLRFLDSTEEEQKRGITMHSSAIALSYKFEEKSESTASAEEEYLINLVDSPGHIDFSSDVSTAARLCDGALIIVDVLEGVCTQTHAVIYKALKERMRPCLVLNKIDRLIIELRLSPIEAFSHLRRIIENVNALAFQLVNSEYIKTNEAAAAASGNPSNGDNTLPDDHPLTQEWSFSPEKGNIQFASALDGWGFGLMKFINHWHKKIGLNKGVLRKYIFEDYAINMATKKITKIDFSDAVSEPMFVTLVLNPIWRVYETLILQQDVQSTLDYVKNEFDISLVNREINQRDNRFTLQSIMRKWLPLADSILRMVIRNLPNPREAQEIRVSTLLTEPVDSASLKISRDSKFVAMESHLQSVRQSVRQCSNDPTAPLVVFISKVMPVKVGELSKRDVDMINKIRFERDGSDENALKADHEIFVALGRVFSGVLTRDSDLFVVGHKHDPMAYLTEAFQNTDSAYNVPDVVLSSDATLPSAFDGAVSRVKRTGDKIGCYLLLGPSVYPADSVPAGNIVGIVGLEDYVLKTATVSNSWLCYPLKAITFQSKPMLKVAVEPLQPQDLRKLESGMQSLYQFDPVVEIGVDESGQRTMTCLGELHLDQCVKALIDRFARCELKVSEPLVSFRETIARWSNDGADESSVPPPWSDMPGITRAKRGRVRFSVEARNIGLTIRCFPLPVEVASILERDTQGINKLSEILADSYATAQSTITNADHIERYLSTNKNIERVWRSFIDGLTQEKALNPDDLGPSATTSEDDVSVFINRLITLGPRQCPTNILTFASNCNIEVWDHSLAPFYSADTSQGNAVYDGSTTAPESSQRLCDISISKEKECFYKIWQRIHSAVVAGFQETVTSGPLMQEDLHGVVFVLEKIELLQSVCEQILSAEERSQLFPASSLGSAVSSVNASIHMGQLISQVGDHLRLAMLSCPVRIVEPIFQCDLQCDQSQLGNLYAVLSKRRGTVFKEDIIEGTNLFLLSAHLPVAMSFQFAQELLKRTSGSGTAPQLSFSHWQLFEQDPFWRPRTDDEKEEFGELFLDEHNPAKSWINKVRKRKGLVVDEQVVLSAEKQRTLSRKK